MNIIWIHSQSNQYLLRMRKKMQEQQCFSLCLSCSIRKGRLKDSILQHNLYFYINIKRNMNPEGLQARTAKSQVPVKVNVSFPFQSSINSRLPKQQTSVYWTWAIPVYFIYLLIIQADREISFPFIGSFEEFKSIPVEARKEKPPQGMHLRLELLPIQWHQSSYCWRG